MLDSGIIPDFVLPILRDEERIAIAKNSLTPISILEQLASDRESKVRKAVAENASTPLNILE